MATRILVVDDSPTIRTVASQILERHGYDPTTAFDGQDAYEVLVSGEVKADLVLVDFVMPRMNGYQFCRALRTNIELATTPVVLMSAKADRIRDQFVQQTGALDAISKPFDPQALVAVIENALRKANTNRGSSARLPDVETDVMSMIVPSSQTEYETRRTPVAEIVGQKLATIAAAAISESPEFVASTNLAKVLADRLSKEAIVEMMSAISEDERKDGGGSLLSGDLGVVPIGAILQLLQAENQTGVLVCRSGSAEVRATFRAGTIDLVQSTGAGDEFRLGRYFIEEGILTADEIDRFMQKTPSRATTIVDPFEIGQSSLSNTALPSTRELPAVDALTRAVEIAPMTVREDPHARVTLPGDPVISELTSPTEKPRPLGMALLGAGKIVDAQLRTALTRQSSELLYEVLRWSTGRFDLRREPPSELAENAKLGMPVASVVMEGFRRVDEWRALERTLGSFDAVLVRDDSALGTLDVVSLPAREKAVLDAVDGVRPVRAIVTASNVSSFDACRILVQFLEARVLRRRAG